MARFSNSDDGMALEERCRQWVRWVEEPERHEEFCPVHTAHHLLGTCPGRSDECDVQKLLDMLVPDDTRRCFFFEEAGALTVQCARCRVFYATREPACPQCQLPQQKGTP